MSKIIEVPGYGEVEFPDDMADRDIELAIRKNMMRQDAPQNPTRTAPEPTPEPTLGSRLSAGAGGLNRGIAGVLGLPMDTIQNVYNLGAAAVGQIPLAMGRPDLAPRPVSGTPLSSEWIADKMSRLGAGTGNPNPQDPASQMLHTGGMIIGGSAVPGARVGQTLAAAAGGAVAEQIDPRLMPLGAMAPAVATQAAGGVKNYLGGNAAQNVKTFEKAGVTPTAGQATEHGFFRGLENLISRFPGGTNVMRKFSEQQQIALGNAARRGTADAETAGRAIESGVRGEGGFMARFKATQDQLYGELDKHIPLSTRIDVSRTRNALEDLNASIPGAPELSKQFKNARIQGIESALKADLQGTGGTRSALPAWEQNRLEQIPGVQGFAELAAANDNRLPYEAIRKLRTLVGREISDATIASDVPRSKWKALYAALSDDLGAAAKQTSPQAEQAWSRANTYSRSAIDRIESVLDKVIGKDRLPEDIFRAVNPTNPDQANRIRTVMRSLRPDEREIVSNAIVNRMGRASPGKQNEAGEVWSSETFLTNWNRMSPGAKAQIMPSTQMRSDLEAIASVASNIREGSKVFANPSGTAGAVAPYGLTAMAATGNVIPAAGLVVGADLGARLLTSPKFTNWLARASKAPPEAMPSQLTRLAIIYNSEQDPEIKRELERYVGSVSQTRQ